MPRTTMTRPALALLLLASPALAEVPRVVADTPITQSLAAQVMGDLGTPDLLLDPGADPHHAALRPSQARALARAGLVIWSGEGMTPWLHGPIDVLANGAVLDLAAAPGLQVQDFQPSVLLDEPGDATDDADHDHEHEHEQGHTGTDPHLWLDPANANAWVQAIAGQLSALDPEHATAYAANADRASSDIAALTTDLTRTFAPARAAGLVMFHDAYGYAAKVFGLNVLGTIALGDAASPGAARLTALRAALAGAGAICLFPEVNHPPALVTLIAEGTDLRIGAALDPAGLLQTPGPALYGQTMRTLARAIADCATAP